MSVSTAFTSISSTIGNTISDIFSGLKKIPASVELTGNSTRVSIGNIVYEKITDTNGKTSLVAVSNLGNGSVFGGTNLSGGVSGSTGIIIIVGILLLIIVIK
jgi:hypothetical protein